MEPIGATASVIALIKTTKFLARSIQSLYLRWRHAPSDLHTLAALLLSIEARLDVIASTSATGHPLIINDESRRNLENLLKEAGECVGQFEDILARVQRYGSLRQRAMWAMQESQRMDKTTARLRTLEDRLSAWLQVLSLRGQCSTLTGIDELKQLLGDLAISSPTQNTAIVSKPALLPATTLEMQKRVLQKNPLVLGNGWASWGVRGSLIPTSQGHYRDFCFAMQASTPFSQILGRYVIVIVVSMRTFALCPMKLMFRHPTALAVSRLVDNDNEFMMACDRGDTLAVRAMLRDGRGRPTDVAERNWTPLTFAIRSGSTDVVAELLDSGADLDGTFGLLQTTPLQWSVWQQQLDVTRLLLSRGASQDHLNNIGWNVTFCCWPKLQYGQRCMLDFLHLLADHSIQDLEIADTEGWTVLHRVAAYATVEEVLALIKQGASPDQVALPLRWNAIHHAVYYGNEATFKALLPFYGDGIRTLTDERGWTLLHIAASMGHDAIVRELLRQGLDPNALSRPFMSHMPESIFKRACTPRQVAAAHSQECEEQFLKAWWDSGIGGIASDVHVDDDGDVFWEVTEELTK